MAAAASCASGLSMPALFDSRVDFFLAKGFAKLGLILVCCCFFLFGTVRAARLDIDGGSLQISPNSVLNLKALLASSRSTNHLQGVGMKVFHRDAPHLRERRSERTATYQNMTAVSIRKRHRYAQIELKSTTLKRQDSIGEYYMPLQLGSPSRDILVILDTGSEMLWVQCQPCNKCGSQIIEPVFDPTRSSTYNPVYCSSQSCLQGSVGFGTSCNPSHSLCEYQVQYIDKSISVGDLSVDTLTLNSTSGTPTTITGFQFGCGHTNEGPLASVGASGLMGLSRGKNSFISQISAHYPRIFFYCFPDRINNLKSSGFIHFGKSFVSQHLQYTPLIQNTASIFFSQFYYINVIGISVNGRLLPIPTDAFAIDASGNGGTLLDTGMLFSVLVDPAFSVLKQAFLNGTKNLKRVPDPSGVGLDICYNVPASTSNLPKVPSVELHLQGDGAKLSLYAENLLWVVAEDKQQKTLCLAMQSAGAVGKHTSVIGNYQMTNHIVEVDIEKSRLGLADAHCAME